MKAGLPPKQVIFEDPSHTTYDVWDLRLLKAYYFLEDFLVDGVPVWWDESDMVGFEVERRTSQAKAAVERARDRDSADGKKPVPGRYYVPVPVPIQGDELPTFKDWVEEMRRKNPEKR